MKVYHYIFSWLLTLLIGLILGTAFSGELTISLAFTAVAAMLSAPFMAIFCIVMFIYIKKKPSTSALHGRTFMLHAIGSLLTVATLTLVAQEFMPLEINLAILGYFVVDSICFHAYISAKHVHVEEPLDFNGDILDNPSR